MKKTRKTKNDVDVDPQQLGQILVPSKCVVLHSFLVFRFLLPAEYQIFFSSSSSFFFLSAVRGSQQSSSRRNAGGGEGERKTVTANERAK